MPAGSEKDLALLSRPRCVASAGRQAVGRRLVGKLTNWPLLVHLHALSNAVQFIQSPSNVRIHTPTERPIRLRHAIYIVTYRMSIGRRGICPHAKLNQCSSSVSVLLAVPSPSRLIVVQIVSCRHTCSVCAFPWSVQLERGKEKECCCW